jgi:hypothetical protein
MTRSLRACPLCGSKAISASERVEGEDGGVRLELRCGECWTWRTATGRRAARALERRLRRDRERMAVSTGQAARWRDLELERLTQRLPQGASRKTYR